MYQVVQILADQRHQKHQLKEMETSQSKHRYYYYMIRIIITVNFIQFRSSKNVATTREQPTEAVDLLLVQFQMELDRCDITINQLKQELKHLNQSQVNNLYYCVS